MASRALIILISEIPSHHIVADSRGQSWTKSAGTPTHLKDKTARKLLSNADCHEDKVMLRETSRNIFVFCEFEYALR